LRVVATEPADGAGLDCERSAPDCGVPTDTTLTVRFDRFLRPDTAIRQSIVLFTGDRGNLTPPPSNTRPELVPEYDLVERSVRYRLPPGFTLRAGALYTVELPLASDDQPFGFRAFDGAPLASDRALRMSFRTAAGPGPAVAPLAVPSCDELLALLSPCASSGCHGSREPSIPPSMGLALDSWDALARTALGKPAHQTEVGATIGQSAQAPVRFGANMPVIDEGRPDNSYLMYKLLLSPDVYLPGPGESCAEGARCEPPDPAELVRLAEWFVRGEAMPASGVLHHGAASSIQAFIADPRDCLGEE
jgi:hypothetical protein